MFGDFNLPEIGYETFSVAGDATSYPARFFDPILDLFLIQTAFGFTRVRQGQRPSKLDDV
jgi:hypothetical protein